MPWKKSTFSENTIGLPSPLVYRVCVYSKLLQSAIVIATQVVYLAHIVDLGPGRTLYSLSFLGVNMGVTLVIFLVNLADAWQSSSQLESWGVWPDGAGSGSISGFGSVSGSVSGKPAAEFELTTSTLPRKSNFAALSPMHGSGPGSSKQSISEPDFIPNAASTKRLPLFFDAPPSGSSDARNRLSMPDMPSSVGGSGPASILRRPRNLTASAAEQPPVSPPVSPSPPPRRESALRVALRRLSALAPSFGPASAPAPALSPDAAAAASAIQEPHPVPEQELGSNASVVSPLSTALGLGKGERGGAAAEGEAAQFQNQERL